MIRGSDDRSNGSSCTCIDGERITRSGEDRGGDMSNDHERVIAICQDVADWLRAVAMDQDEDLTPAERRKLIEIALEVERRSRLGEAPSRQ